MQSHRETHETHLPHIVIVGAGLCGLSLALALRDMPLRITLLESHPMLTRSVPENARALALSWGSCRILQQLGMWEMLQPHLSPIHGIHVSAQGHLGVVRMTAQREHVDQLGHVCNASALHQTLLQAALLASNITVLDNRRVQSVTMNAQRAEVRCHSVDSTEDQWLSADLLVAADGKKSAISQQLGLEAVDIPCEHHALIARLAWQRPHKSQAYQRFLGAETIAFLPHKAACEGTLVWTMPEHSLAQWQHADSKSLAAKVQQDLGWRLGPVGEVNPRLHHYPLQCRYLSKPAMTGFACVGDAAHSLPPIAAQGFNLALRDVAVLGELCADSLQQGQKLGAMPMMERYMQLRQPDVMNIMSLTQRLLGGFIRRDMPLDWLRSAGLLGLGLLSPLRHRVARLGMGTFGWQPRLQRGLPAWHQRLQSQGDCSYGK